MNRRKLIKNALALSPLLLAKKASFAAIDRFQARMSAWEPGMSSFAPGTSPLGPPATPFLPNWNSLANYKAPEWFRDAKFGIWAHWGPQCQPEYGDWYARGMYQEDSDQYKFHLEKYGHPSVFGFKDMIRQWKAENWQPEELVGLYKDAGARYFVALANHHDNFDNYDSSHQPWNSVRIGPRKDLIGGWASAAKKHGLHFGVSVHASHAWSWYEVAQRHDAKGPKTGIPYDGKTMKKDGAGKWWQAYDPQDLYEQRHPLSANSADDSAINGQWNWANGVTPPSKQYCGKFYLRTIELIDKYHPDLLYFDDNALPLWPVSDVGLRIAAHMYNASIRRHGSMQAVINGKMLDEQQRKCMIWDIERGQSNEIMPFPWQTDTCIGGWHYDRRILERHHYKSATTVIHTLVDVVSKNGNLLLSIPVKADGTIDQDERDIVKGISAWMKINSESIYGTRPYVVFGEGPAMKEAAALSNQGFNEGKGKPFTAEDIRFARKNNVLYATTMGMPTHEVLIKTLKDKHITAVEWIGHNDRLSWQQQNDGIRIEIPGDVAHTPAAVFRITGDI
jgi:alpha-L-fucosidase